MFEVLNYIETQKVVIISLLTLNGNVLPSEIVKLGTEKNRICDKGSTD